MPIRFWNESGVCSCTRSSVHEITRFHCIPFHLRFTKLNEIEYNMVVRISKWIRWQDYAQEVLHGTKTFLLAVFILQPTPWFAIYFFSGSFQKLRWHVGMCQFVFSKIIIFPHYFYNGAPGLPLPRGGAKTNLFCPWNSLVVEQNIDNRGNPSDFSSSSTLDHADFRTKFKVLARFCSVAAYG
jgi:hypothetical protein